MSNVLVTGIGGNVGYGILRNIKNSFDDIVLTGTNTTPISAGNHLCNAVYTVPFATDSNYIPAMKRICDAEHIELIIPSTDYESYILAKNASELPCVAVSPPDTTRIFLDKYLSFTTFQSMGLAFAQSVLPADFRQDFDSYIIKPREGRGSRNLFYNPADPEKFSDEYIIQPLLTGKEITTAFYVTKQNELHGMITFERELASGATQTCEVIMDHDEELKQYILKLIGKLPIRGACNIQCIVTEQGIIPFEVNCRISGTNSIRSQFGFEDVRYTVEEYLYNKTPTPPAISKGCAIRILHDIIYPGIRLNEVKNNSDNFYINE